MKSKFTLLFTLLLMGTAHAQEVPQKIIVEHFTNTLCSTCASRNPGFYTNFNTENTGNMLHLAIHPSSPYSACIFNQHDKTANDERTKYYNIFGSTPRLVINGKPISASTNYNSAAIFAPYVGLMSAVKITMTQQKFGADSIQVQVVLKTVASHSLGNQNLYLVLAEDTIFYNAPNGEDEHYDVFRRSLLGSTGMSVTIPATVGDSLVITKTTAAHADWDFDRIYPLAILQDESTKITTQAEALVPVKSIVSGITNLETSLNYKVYPTLTNVEITIETEQNLPSSLRIISITGTEVIKTSIKGNTLVNVSNLPNGVYFVLIENANGFYNQKIIKY